MTLTARHLQLVTCIGASRIGVLGIHSYSPPSHYPTHIYSLQPRNLCSLIFSLLYRGILRL
jgi:hypothetical protein